jgi:hypothetical protein
MSLRGWLALGVVSVTSATLIEMAASSTDFGQPRTTIMVAALGLLGLLDIETRVGGGRGTRLWTSS